MGKSLDYERSPKRYFYRIGGVYVASEEVARHTEPRASSRRLRRLQRIKAIRRVAHDVRWGRTPTLTRHEALEQDWATFLDACNSFFRERYSKPPVPNWPALTTLLPLHREARFK